MSRLVPTLAALAAMASVSFVLGPTPASAADPVYPVCWADSPGLAGIACEFDTMAQCQATVSGTAGYCENNPAGTTAYMRIKAMPEKGLPFNHTFLKEKGKK